jgi:hypothetical protein
MRDDGYDDIEAAVVLTTVRVSRKIRTCATCLGTIHPGEQYVRHFLPPDGDHEKAMTITEHASAGICYTVLGQEATP